jgi:predicted enzyme related to lactoylglutathione lyase
MARLGQARYPAGVPCWVELTEPNGELSTSFFGDLLGWRFEDRAPGGAADPYFVAILTDQDGDVAGFGSLLAETVQHPIWTTYVRVDSADESAERVSTAGGTVLRGPTDVEGIARVAVCTDPAGARFGLWEARGSGGAHLVNRPGTWNFSNLVTSDPESAADFYGKVFGWRTQNVRFGGGEQDATMLILPGYGDFLEELAPGTRDRHTETGAPEGFSDAVGWLSAVPYEALAETVPQWTVEFSVADAESILSRAAQLGGTVVTPLADMGGMRYGAFQDPRGAAMAINEFHQPPA